MKKILPLLFALASVTAFSQSKDMPFEKDLFKDKDKDAFKEARSNFNKGKDLYDDAVKAMVNEGDMDTYEFKLRESVPFFQKAYAFNPNYSFLNYMMAVALYEIKDRATILELFLKAYELNPTVNPDIHGRIGEAYHLRTEWDKAIYHFELYKKTLNQKDHVEIIES
ncbi:MAG: tetratricopeptide repeat protein, partial [Flavobacteriales bacterium]